MSLPNHITRTLLSLILMLVSFPGLTQIENHLIIKKNGFKNKVHYLAGDAIWLEWNKLQAPVDGIIAGIGIDQILINGMTIPIAEVTKVHRYRTGFNFRAGGKTLQIAAPGFLAVVAANTLIRGDRPIWPSSTLLTSGILLTSGLILPVFQVKHYRMGGKYSLKIVKSDPALLKHGR